MNTKKPTPLDELDLTGASQALAAGLPDPAALARLATEMYREFQQALMPADSAIPGGVQDGRIPPTPEAPEALEAPVSGLTLAGLPVGTGPSTEARLQSAASEISGMSASIPVNDSLP